MSTTIAVRVISRPRTCLAVLVLITGVLSALVWATFTSPAARVVYNASDSVPIGWYRVTPIYAVPDADSDPVSDAIPVGSLVLTHLPPDAAMLADQRGYLPLQIPLLKRVGAVAPQHVCIAGSTVHIDGVPVAAVLPADVSGRPLSSWHHCRQLYENELFLLSNTTPVSFDSRYFGPVSMRSVIGVAQRLDLESAR